MLGDLTVQQLHRLALAIGVSAADLLESVLGSLEE